MKTKLLTILTLLLCLCSSGVWADEATIKIGNSTSASYASSFTSSSTSEHVTASATKFTTGSSTTTSNSSYTSATAPYSVKIKPSSSINTSEYSDAYSISANFTVAEGYVFSPSSISATIVTEAANYSYRAILTDGTTSYISNEVSSSSNGKSTFSFLSLTGEPLAGDVTFKIQFKSTANNSKYFVVNLPITIIGNVEEKVSDGKTNLVGAWSDEAPVYEYGAEAELPTFTVTGGEAVAGTDYSVSYELVSGSNVTVNSSTGITAIDTENAGESVVKATITVVNTGDYKATITEYQTTITVNSKAAPQPTKLLYWQYDSSTTTADKELSATGGTVTLKTSDASKSWSSESATYVASVEADMKATGSKGLKGSGNANYLIVKLTSGTFEAGDIIYITGYNDWKISSSDSNGGDVIASLGTGKDKSNYATGNAKIPVGFTATNTLYLTRANGSGTGVAAIKIIRPVPLPQPTPC